jgi:hypothetical protein
VCIGHPRVEARHLPIADHRGIAFTHRDGLGQRCVDSADVGERLILRLGALGRTPQDEADRIPWTQRFLAR